MAGDTVKTGAKLAAIPSIDGVLASQDGSSAVLSLDSCNKFSIVLFYDASTRSLTLSLVDNDPAIKSDDTALKDLVSQGLVISAHGNSSTLTRENSDLGSISLNIDRHAQLFDVQVTLFDKPLLSLCLDPTDGEIIHKTQHRLLHAYDLRNFTVHGESYIERFQSIDGRPKYRPLIDTHTHYSGQIESETLIREAIEIKLPYPVDLLLRVGISRDFPDAKTQGGRSTIILDQLTPEERRRLAAHMHIEPTEIITFEQMEGIYALRAPMTKNVELFPAFLRDIAARYREKGVKYVELSLSTIADAGWLRKAHECLPRIEQETGVQIRFLVGMWRHNPVNYNLDLADQAMYAAAISPYIVGVDFMGHETNSVLYFRDVISSKDPWDPNKTLVDPRTGQLRGDGLKQFADKNPGFQIRVHAGENPVDPSAIKEAVKAGATAIGHGLYGDKDLPSEGGIRLEFNPNSNRALNNVDGLSQSELPIVDSMKQSGTHVTLGSDGTIYRAGGVAESYVASMAGVSKEQFIEIAKGDLEYMRKMRGMFESNWNLMITRCLETVVNQYKTDNPTASHTDITDYSLEMHRLALAGARGPIYQKVMTQFEIDNWGAFEEKILKAGNYGLPTSESFPKSTFDWQTWRTEQKRRVAELTEKLKERNITTRASEDLSSFFNGRRPVLISGASRKSWPEITDQQAVKDFLRQLVKNSNPDEMVFVTGATHFGVEEELHQIIVDENSIRSLEGKKTFEILGTVVEETNPEELGPITDAVLLGERWYSKSGMILNIVNQLNGMVIFIGGGDILKDEIQAAYNLRSQSGKFKFYLMDGPEGASTKKVDSHPDRGFKTYKEFEEKNLEDITASN
jgi:adenosine deaminase